MPGHFPSNDIIPTKHDGLQWGLAAKSIDSALAAVVSTFILYPFDVAKTRFQNQQIKMLYTSTLDCVRKMIKHETIRGIYRGSLVNILLIAPEKTLKLLTNDLLRGQLKKSHNPLPIQMEIFAAAVAGITQSSVSTPMDLMKISLQDSGRVKAMDIMTNHKTANAAKKPLNARQVAMNVFRKKGFLGFYQGFVPNVSRNVLFSIVYFPAFYKINGLGLKNVNLDSSSTPSWAFISGCLAGGVSATAATPFDVVKTRMQRLKLAKGETHYLSTLEAFRKILKDEGARALMRGAGVRTLVIGPFFGILQSLYYLQIGGYFLGVK